MFLHLVLFVLLKFPLWHFVFLLPALLPKGGFGRKFTASTIIGDVLFRSLHFKIQVCRHPLRRWPTLSIEQIVSY
jgi:hypothetical protein